MSRPRWQSDLPLALAALLISFTIWIMAKMSTLETEQLPIPVLLTNLPPNVKVDYAPKNLMIVVKFPQSQRAKVVAPNFEVKLDAEEILGGNLSAGVGAGITEPVVHTYNLTLDNVHATNLPQSVRVTDIGSQSKVTIEAMLFTQSLPIVATTSGALPPNFELGSEIRTEPVKALVTAAPDVLKLWSQPDSKLSTEPIKLDDHKADFIAYADLRIPPGLTLVNPEQKKVEVFVGVKEKEITRTIENVPIRIFIFSDNLTAKFQPPFAQVRVKGRISLIDRVEAGMFTFAPKDSLAEEVGVRKAVELIAALSEDAPADIRKGVEVQGFTPAKVDVEFVKGDKSKLKPQKEQP
ncbi:hypothetical protein HYR69_11775 [Candidatus Sumerlaeota bacterium]|nr:hypothetical protein [Candidatus Sumerlaeota bacterium]MBI3735003.1 hypothetical protein [Candidatus Sumerlaeota bacterium]